MYQKLNIFFSEKKKQVHFSNLELKINGRTIERIGEGCNCTQNSFKFVGINLDEFSS